MSPKTKLKTKTRLKLATYVAVGVGICALVAGFVIASSNVYKSGKTSRDNIYTNLDACLCGNGVLDKFEECDDGNRNTGDGCGVNCMNESKKIVLINEVQDPNDSQKDSFSFSRNECSIYTLPFNLGLDFGLNFFVDKKGIFFNITQSNKEDGKGVNSMIQVSEEGINSDKISKLEKQPCLIGKVLEFGGERWKIMGCGPLAIRRGDDLQCVRKEQINCLSQYPEPVKSDRKVYISAIQYYNNSENSIGTKYYYRNDKYEPGYFICGTDGVDETKRNLASFEIKRDRTGYASKDGPINIGKISFHFLDQFNKVNKYYDNFEKVFENLILRYKDKSGEIVDQSIDFKIGNKNVVRDENNNGYYVTVVLDPEKPIVSDVGKPQEFVILGDIKKGKLKISSMYRIGIKSLAPGHPLNPYLLLDVTAINDPWVNFNKVGKLAGQQYGPYLKFSKNIEDCKSLENPTSPDPVDPVIKPDTTISISPLNWDLSTTTNVDYVYSYRDNPIYGVSGVNEIKKTLAVFAIERNVTGDASKDRVVNVKKITLHLVDWINGYQQKDKFETVFENLTLSYKDKNDETVNQNIDFKVGDGNVVRDEGNNGYYVTIVLNPEKPLVLDVSKPRNFVIFGDVKKGSFKVGSAYQVGIKALVSNNLTNNAGRLDITAVEDTGAIFKVGQSSIVGKKIKQYGNIFRITKYKPTIHNFPPAVPTSTSAHSTSSY